MHHKKQTALTIALILIVTIVVMTIKGDLSGIDSVEELGRTLGIISLFPTVVAVLLSFITNNIIFALLVSFLLGVLILSVANGSDLLSKITLFATNTVQGIGNVLIDSENIEMLILCAIIGGMVEVVKLSGGFEALSHKLSNRIQNAQQASLMASVLGCLIFFDDYANTLILPPVMKKISERVGMSKEKLGFLINSTAAPVSGIAIVTSWLAVEVSSIEKGLNIMGSALDGSSLLIKSIPYCFFVLLIIAFTFVLSFVGKDFGPMLKAEREARKNADALTMTKSHFQDDRPVLRIVVSIGSTLLMLLFALISFVVSGRQSAISAGELMANAPMTFDNLLICVSCAQTVRLIIIACLLAIGFALILGLSTSLFSLKEATRAFVKGIKEILSTIMLLVCAWCLADTIKKLGTTYYAIDIITNYIPWLFVPVLLFVCCCMISFASGSFGTMFVMMPLAIPLAAEIMKSSIACSGDIYLLVCIGAVLSGSIFGDHSSMITDDPILSSSGAGCTIIQLFNATFPYGMMVAFISIVLIIMVCLNLPVWVALLIGVIMEAMIMTLFGQRP